MAFVFFGLLSSFAESEYWRQFRKAEGLGETPSAHLSLSPDQVLWVSHPRSGKVSRSNGYPQEGSDRLFFQSYSDPEHGNFRIYEEKGQNWSLMPGGLRVIINFNRNIYSFALNQMDEDLLANRSKLYRTAISRFPLIPIENNRSLILLSDDIISFHVGDESTVSLLDGRASDIVDFFAMGRVLEKENSIWIAGRNGIALISIRPELDSPSNGQEDYPMPDGYQLEESPVFENEFGMLTALAESSPAGKEVLAHFDLRARTWRIQSLPDSLNLSFCWPGLNDETWGWDPNTYKLVRIPTYSSKEYTAEEIALSGCYDVVRQSGGGFFLATPEGVYHYAPPIWRIPVGLEDMRFPIQEILEVDSVIWGVNSSNLVKYENEKAKLYPLPASIIPDIPSPHLHLSSMKDRIMVGIEDRLYSFDPQLEEFTTIRNRACRAIGVHNEFLVTQTYSLNDSVGIYHLELFDGSSFVPYASLQEESGERPELRFFFKPDPEDTGLWLGGADGIRVVKDGRPIAFDGAAMLDENGAYSILKVQEDRIWWGGKNQIIEHRSGTWNPLRAEDFDTVYDLEMGEKEDIWVATGNGLFRYLSNSWILNEAQEGLEAAATFCLMRDSGGVLWAGTSRGLYRYHPDADKDGPTMIIDKENSPRRISRDSSHLIGFTGIDRWHRTRTDRLLYRFQIDNQEWNSFFETENNMIPFTAALDPGRHQIKFQAMDRNGNIQTGFTSHEFEIILPWFEDIRLTVFISFGGILILFFIGLSYRKHLQLAHSYSQVEQKVKERTRELERANEALLHSQKMQALGTLAAGIAHDFNNILSIIKGSAQLIEKDQGRIPKVQTRLNRINTVVEQGSTLVQSLLGFSRSDQAPKSDLNIEEVVRGTINLLGDRYLHKVDILYVFPDTPVYVRASRDIIQQILLNLVMNAVDSMNDRGQIRLSLSLEDRIPKDPVLLPGIESTYVCIRIRDNGVGISPEIRPRIFEPFFTTKSFSSRRGTGLGLSMVYKLAEEMEFGLTVESTPGEGSEFTLFVPIGNDQKETDRSKS